jgi:hypothetical protein
MAGNTLKIKLTDDQQKQIKDATGKNITELNIDTAAMSALTEEQLGQASGGVGEIVITKGLDPA